jgi:putative endonuclease
VKGVAVTAAHIALGRQGEDLAAGWYRRRGYEVVARNWRCPLGEIDLVARRRRVIVICEVKTRRSDAFGAPALAVGAVKQQRLRRLAAQWLATSGPRGLVEVRFDVVAISGDRVDVFEAAF